MEAGPLVQEDRTQRVLLMEEECNVNCALNLGTWFRTATIGLISHFVGPLTLMVRFRLILLKLDSAMGKTFHSLFPTRLDVKDQLCLECLQPQKFSLMKTGILILVPLIILLLRSRI